MTTSTVWKTTEVLASTKRQKRQKLFS